MPWILGQPQLRSAKCQSTLTRSALETGECVPWLGLWLLMYDPEVPSLSTWRLLSPDTSLHACVSGDGHFLGKGSCLLHSELFQGRQVSSVAQERAKTQARGPEADPAFWGPLGTWHRSPLSASVLVFSTLIQKHLLGSCCVLCELGVCDPEAVTHTSQLWPPALRPILSPKAAQGGLEISDLPLSSTRPAWLLF